MTDDDLREAIRICRLMANPYMGNPLCLPIEQTALERLASYAEAQMGRRCEHCWHQRQEREDGPYVCGKVSIWGHSVAQVRCITLGNTCGAWTAKEDTTNG